MHLLSNSALYSTDVFASFWLCFGLAFFVFLPSAIWKRIGRKCIRKSSMLCALVATSKSRKDYILKHNAMDLSLHSDHFWQVSVAVSNILVP